MEATKEYSATPLPFTRFLWWLSTANPKILADCGPERDRYSIVGMSVLVTWLFATMSWGYFFSTVTSNYFIICLLALFFGFAILSIDRSLIAAMSNSKGKTVGFLPVLFRLALAATIGFFLAQPIVLMLFKKDITTQIALNKEKKLKVFKQKLDEQNVSLINNYETQIASINKRWHDEDSLVRFYKDSYIKETDGTGGSGKIGEAAIARVKKNEYLKSEQAFEETKKELLPKLNAYEDSLKSIIGGNNNKVALYTSTLSDGFLTQVEALTDLLTEHPPLKMRYTLIILIITLIEVMPVLTKLLLPKGEYEERVLQATSLSMDKATLQAEREKALQSHYANLSVESDKAAIERFFKNTDKEKEIIESDVKSNINGKSYSGLWELFRDKMFSKKEI